MVMISCYVAFDLDNLFICCIAYTVHNTQYLGYYLIIWAGPYERVVGLHEYTLKEMSVSALL